jgi:hypothetical protein
LFVEGAENLTIAPGSLTGLKDLYLRGAGANATRSLFRNFPHLQKLEHLELTGGWTTTGAADAERSVHVDDELMQHVASLKALKLLWFSAREARITDQGVSHLAGLVNLQRIYLSGDGITNGALVHFKPLKQLRELYLNNTSVDQEAAAKLKADLPEATNIQAYRLE